MPDTFMETYVPHGALLTAETPASPRRRDLDAFCLYHEDLCTNARALSLRKGADYASADTADGSDPFQRFRNFMMCERAGICSTEQGIVVRLFDKITRLAQLTAPSKIAQVKNESLDDTVLDVINYSVLLSAYLDVKRAVAAAAKKD